MFWTQVQHSWNDKLLKMQAPSRNHVLNVAPFSQKFNVLLYYYQFIT